MIAATLDHLHDDNESLKACSLVCKDWTHAAHRLLFSRWTMDLHRHAGASIDWSLRISTVLPFLRHLCVKYGGLREAWDADLPLLIEQNHVQSFHLFYLRQPDSYSFQVNRPPSAFLRNFSGLVTLRLQSISFSNLSTFLEIVCGFPRLQTLSIQGDLRYYELPSTTFQLSPHLLALQLDIWGLDDILEWFLTFTGPPSFRSLCLYHHSTIDRVMMQAFIATLSEGMEHLSLPMYESPQQLFDFSRFRQLRSIQLSLHYPSAVDSVTRVLSHLSSPRLEVVAFYLDYEEGPDPDNDPHLVWEEVDALLQSSLFDGLKDVHVESPQEFKPWVIDNVSRSMSRCRARGILRICGDRRYLRFYGI